jgi:GTP:adenosylcobinamide-phosphate guanylyltransferase
MDTVLLAGGIPKPEDVLYPYSNGKPKALIDVAGKPMIQWVLDALNGTEIIEKIVIVGLEDLSGVTSQKPLVPISNQGGLIENLKAGAEKLEELDPQVEYILMTSSDIPSITSEMIAWVINTAKETDHDLYYNVVERASMETRFPGANRTFAKLKGIQVCGADLGVLRVKTVTHNEELWTRLAESRKSIIKQAALIGFDTLFMILFRLTDLEATAKQISKRIGINARAIISPYAELAMDVDKPHQLEILIQDRSQAQL